MGFSDSEGVNEQRICKRIRKRANDGIESEPTARKDKHTHTHAERWKQILNELRRLKWSAHTNSTRSNRHYFPNRTNSGICYRVKFVRFWGGVRALALAFFPLLRFYFMSFLLLHFRRRRRRRSRLQIFKSIFLVCPDLQWRIKWRKKNSKTKVIEKKIPMTCAHNIHTPRHSYSFPSLFFRIFLRFAFGDGFDRYQSNIYVEMCSLSLLFPLNCALRCLVCGFSCNSNLQINLRCVNAI